MRFSRILRLNPRTKVPVLKNELEKPLWEYASGQIAGKPTHRQGPPSAGRYENEFDRIHTPRLAPHLDPSCSLAGIPRDIEHHAYVSCEKYAPAGGVDGNERTLHEDLERFRTQYWIQLERRRCGGSPNVTQTRDVYDIVLKDTHAIHPALSMFSKHKENVELLGQYDGQPNKFNEKILSLDVEKILYYVGLGVSLGQDVAELLGLCGLLPIHPQTNLRLKKLHETRKNMLHKNADNLHGHDNAMDAAFDIIQNLDRQERIDAEGFDVFYYGEEEWTQHDQKIAKIREEREARREEYEQKIIAEKEKVEEARKRYYDAIKAQGMVDYDALNAFAIGLAKECGEILSKAFHERDHDVVTKASDVDLVTKTDQLIEKTIMDKVKDKYPDHKFIGEEDTAAGREIVLTDDITWVIDPVDGTTNFVCGFPYTAVCIGIMEKKEPIIGIVNNPIMKELFHARIGKGATKNGKPIKSKSETKLNKAVINTEFGSSREPERIATVIDNMKKIVLAPSRGIRGLGSAACNICAVAAGQTDAYFETGMHIWDICAAGLILTEAGGVITSTTGGKLEWLNRNIIATGTNELAQEIASRITEIHVDPDGITA